MSGGAEIFQLFTSENINSNEMDFSMSVLAGLRGTHFNDFARAVLDTNEAVLAERRTLHRIGGRGARVGALESVLMLCPTSVSWK